MARNGAGTYSIPNTFTAGQVINSDDVDENFSDIGTALTGSLPRNGEAGMDAGAQIKADGGSAAAPGMAFGSDPNTGAYSAGADEYGIATGGAQRVGVSSAGIVQTSPSFAMMMPVGVIFDWPGPNAAPPFSLVCAGQAVSRTTYAALFDVIGTRFGAGDGSTTFNLPDLRGRVVAGNDAMGGVAAGRLTATTMTSPDAIGGVGGAQTHTLTTAESAAHTHGVGTLATGSSGSHSHTVPGFNQSGAGNASIYFSESGSGEEAPATTTDGAHTHTLSGSTASTGGGGAHNNVQPTLVLNKYIVSGVAN